MVNRSILRKLTIYIQLCFCSHLYNRIQFVEPTASTCHSYVWPVLWYGHITSQFHENFQNIFFLMYGRTCSFLKIDCKLLQLPASYWFVCKTVKNAIENLNKNGSIVHKFSKLSIYGNIHVIRKLLQIYYLQLP